MQHCTQTWSWVFLAAASLMAFLVISTQAAATPECAMPDKVQIIERNSSHSLESWSLERHFSWESFVELGSGFPALRRYRTRATEARIDLNPIALLKRQRALFLAAFGSDAVKRYDAIIQGSLGSILPLRCLDALLFERHLDRFDVPDRLTEFEAYVLERNDRLTRVYFNSGAGESPPHSNTLQRLLSDALANGMRLRAHLHNHPFMPYNETGDVAGTNIPSGDRSFGDVAHYLQKSETQGLQQAWITNGVNTIVIDSRQFTEL